VESHRRAAQAIGRGVFVEQIAPLHIETRKGSVTVDTDEHVRRDATPESMASLRPAFAKDGSVTAGNSSGINDGAAALMLMTERGPAGSGATPLAEITGYAHAGWNRARWGSARCLRCARSKGAPASSPRTSI